MAIVVGRYAFLVCLLTVVGVRSQLLYEFDDRPSSNEQIYDAFQERPSPFDLQSFASIAEEQASNKNTLKNNQLQVPVEMGQVSGIAVNNEGNLVIFHRADRIWDRYSFDDKTNIFNKSLNAITNATIMVLEPNSGRLIGEYGRGQFYLPHGLSADFDGNYWITDVARHQVIKLNSNFQPILTLGEYMVPGNDDKHFCKPTDVAVVRTGEIFVADGYCNGRIMKFNADGTFSGSFGTPNTNSIKPKNGEFFIPHSLTLIENLNLLCVADRENQRIQCFTAGLSPKGSHQRAINPFGSFVTKAQNIGRIMAIREKENFLVGVTDMNDNNDYQIFIMDIKTGRAEIFAKGIANAHALTLADDGSIYVGQLEPAQVIKFSMPDEETLLNNNYVALNEQKNLFE